MVWILCFGLNLQTLILWWLYFTKVLNFKAVNYKLFYFNWKTHATAILKDPTPIAMNKFLNPVPASVLCCSNLLQVWYMIPFHISPLLPWFRSDKKFMIV